MAPPKTTQRASNGRLSGVLDLCASKRASKEDTHPFPEEYGGVGDSRKLQKGTKLVLERWPYPAVTRQDPSVGEGGQHSPGKETGKRQRM